MIFISQPEQFAIFGIKPTWYFQTGPTKIYRTERVGDSGIVGNNDLS